jgi:hypothetical protein
MSISALSSSSYSPATSSQSTFNALKKDFNELSQALRSNDLSGAQAAFSDLQQLLQKSQASSGQLQYASKSGGSVETDFNSLGTALASGDLSQAQSEFTQLQSDLSAATGGGQHHHHAYTASSANPNGNISLLG